MDVWKRLARIDGNPDRRFQRDHIVGYKMASKTKYCQDGILHVLLGQPGA